MLLSRFETRFFCALLIVLTAAVGAFAQTDNNRPLDERGKNNYEIKLQLLVSGDGANDQTKRLPANLAVVERRLREDFGSGVNHKLILTLVNRAAERGTIEAKGVRAAAPFAASGLTAQNQISFYEFGLNGISTNPQKSNEVLINTAQFGMRVPIIVGAVSQDGKDSSIVNYEQIGMTTNLLSVPFNEPTVIGTLTTERADEQIIVVLTVKQQTVPNADVVNKR